MQKLNTHKCSFYISWTLGFQMLSFNQLDFKLIEHDMLVLKKDTATPTVMSNRKHTFSQLVGQQKNETATPTVVLAFMLFSCSPLLSLHFKGKYTGDQLSFRDLDLSGCLPLLETQICLFYKTSGLCNGNAFSDCNYTKMHGCYLPLLCRRP